MINALEKGDNVKTIGGVFGKVTGVKDDRVVVQIAENVKVEVAKGRCLCKSRIKAIRLDQLFPSSGN